MQLFNDRKSSVEKPELYQALAVSRSSFISTAVFSFFLNLLMLAPVIYMLEVYDRVLSSHSESTLLMLTLLLVFLFVVMGTLEWVRSQILTISGNRLERLLGPRVFDSVFGKTLATGGNVTTTQPLNDLLTLKQFLAGSSLVTLFDAPWMPIYIAIMFAFHPVMGWVAVAAAVILIALAVATERATRDDLKDAGQIAHENDVQTQRNLRNSEVVAAMGMLPRLRERWQARHDQMVDLQYRAGRRGGLIATISKTFRMMMQSMMLGLGAYLAIQSEISGGAVIAGSLLLGRALAPINQLIGSWKSFLGARESYGRLNDLLQSLPLSAPPMPLPAPEGHVEFERASVTPPGSELPVLKGISFVVEPGSAVAVIGPSAAGKSTLVRAILGVYGTSGGSIRLDGAELAQWDRETLGEHIGYLPQDVELLDGNVGENIARFGEVDPEKVIAAARAAGVHHMILKLADGYETKITTNMLSAGQRQRIGLARALYGEPKLVVLDEPNSNLDIQGDQALFEAIRRLKQQGSTLIIVTHRNNILEVVDRVMVISGGELVAYDVPPKVLALLNGAASQAVSNRPQTPLKPIGGRG
ncbi:MAG: type I secretion system permease/ATPase [Gammaproteobacteria bacterium]|nr:type I secretion system permease/ATPase [Gammaproteobacteria bacterium]